MEKRQQFVIKASFPQACQYLQNGFFPQAKEAGIGAWIQLLSPKIVINEPRCFGMKKLLEKNMSLTVQIEETPTREVIVTLTSQYNISPMLIRGLLFSIPTCGIAGVVAGIVIWVKSSRWKNYYEKANSILMVALSG